MLKERSIMSDCSLLGCAPIPLKVVTFQRSRPLLFEHDCEPPECPPRAVSGVCQRVYTSPSSSSNCGQTSGISEEPTYLGIIMPSQATSHTPSIFAPVEVNAETTSTQIQRIRESQYFDTAQQAIWEAVQSGNLEAINIFLKISDRRVKLWGLALETQKTPHDWVVRVEYTVPPANMSP